ncbi:hypothetical protein [Halomonas sp. NO4]|uniref:hypothetical protein n=1 Tax=Halomonas sp. NO4 TaxID=2484813 RepID=UPI003204DE7E
MAFRLVRAARETGLDLARTNGHVQALRTGSTATLSLIGPRGNRMALDISLMGFTDASGRIAP